MPVLARLQAEFQDRGVRVLAVNIDSRGYSQEEWAAFMERFAPPGMEAITAHMAVQDVNNKAISLFELVALGTEVIVDRQGRVTFRSDGSAGYKRLQAEIEEVL